MGKKIKKYLRKVGFNRLEDEPRNLIYHSIDIIASFVYALISGVCVADEKASLLVLFLNGICLFRIISKNMGESSKTTFVIREALKNEHNINSEVFVGNYYSYISLVEIVICAFAVIAMISMGFDMKVVYVKISTIVVIAFVFLDDLSSGCINLYNAGVKPLKSGF